MSINENKVSLAEMKAAIAKFDEANNDELMAAMASHNTRAVERIKLNRLNVFHYKGWSYINYSDALSTENV